MGVSETEMVSVVVPTYDRERLLVEAVESVLAQTYDPIELLVVDDGSPTPAQEVLEDVDLGAVADATIIRHDENCGGNAARNTGIGAASGGFVAFLDDDDYWLPTKLERQVRALRRAEDDVAAVFTGQQCVDGDGRVTNLTRPLPPGDFLTQLTRSGSFGQFSALLVRSDVFDAVGYLDERFPCLQDREFYFRLATEFSYETVPEPLTVRRIADHRQISDDYETKRDVGCPLLLAKHRPTIAANRPSQERHFLAGIHRLVATSALSNGYYKDAIRHSLLTLRYRPVYLQSYVFLLIALGGDWGVRVARLLKRSFNRLYANVTVRTSSK